MVLGVIQVHGIGLPFRQTYPCLIAAQHGLKIRGRDTGTGSGPGRHVDKIYFLLIAVEMSAVHFVYYIWRVLQRIMLILLQLQGKEYCMAAEQMNMKTPAENEKRTYSVQEIADILQISRSMAYNLCSKSLFKTVRVGKYVRVSKPSFDEWLDSK